LSWSCGMDSDCEICQAIMSSDFIGLRLFISSKFKYINLFMYE
jgi:hypothetical protein